MSCVIDSTLKRTCGYCGRKILRRKYYNKVSGVRITEMAFINRKIILTIVFKTRNV